MPDKTLYPNAYWVWKFRALGLRPAQKGFKSLGQRPLQIVHVENRYCKALTSQRKATHMTIIADMKTGDWQMPYIAGKDFYAFEHLETYLGKISEEIDPVIV